MAITGASDGYMVLVPPAQGQSATVSALINRDANGALAVPTEQWIQSPATGLYVPVNYGQPMPTGGGRATSGLTTTALGASATYTGAWVDMQAAGWSYLSASVVADQAGTLYVDAADNQSYPILGVASYAFAPATAGTANAAELPYPVYAKCRYMRLRYVNGTTAQGTFQLYQTTLHASPRDVELTGSLASQTTGITPGGGDTARFVYLSNGTTWDPMQNNAQGSLLASATRTLTAVSPTMSNLNGKGVQVVLNVTSASGTGGLTVHIESIDPVSATVYNLLLASVAVTANGVYVYELYPGATTAGGSGEITQRSAGSLPLVWRAAVVPGDGTNYTYSLGYLLIL